MAMTENDANILLCNQSLGLLGAEAIVKNGSSVNHTYCTTFFDDSRNEVLASHPWNFARKRALAIQTTDPLFGYENAFTMPTDCLRIWKIQDDPLANYRREGSLILTDEGETPPDYDEDEVDYLAGQYIRSDDSGSDLTYLVGTAFTSSSETSDLATYCTSAGDDLQYLQVEYIYQVTGVGSYPPGMFWCCVLNLAIKLSPPIKQSEKVALNLQQMLFGGPKITGYLSLAKSQDAQESGGTSIKTNKFLSARK